MLSLSVTTGYAIKALMCLASENCPTRHISDIADCTGVPKAYLAKILNALSQEGLVQTKRGYRGGISLARPAEDISLLQIVEAVEGGEWFGDCLLGLEGCDVLTTCPTHDFWMRFRQEITKELRKTTLASMLASKQAGNPRKQKSPKSRQRVQCACAQTS